MSAMKALGSHDTGRLLKRVLGDLGKELDSLEEARRAILDAGVSASIFVSGGGGVSDLFYYKIYAFYRHNSGMHRWGSLLIL